MKKELNLSNLLVSLIILTVGIILVIDSDSIINMMSWFIGAVIILISIIKIIYLFNDKILDTSALAVNILLMIFGVVFISFPNIVDLTIRIVFGSWILFAGVKRLIFAIALSHIDVKSYRTFLISAIIMIILGVVVLINFYDLVGIFLIIYAVMEIGNYIFYLVNRKNYSGLYDKDEYDKEDKKIKKKSKVTKEMKNRKAIEADIEE